MTYDASNRKSIRRAEKAAELAIANRISVIRSIMATAPGRDWMHSLLTRCSIFHTPFSPGAPDLTAFNCGQQNIGLTIFADVTAHCPNEYTLMMTEQATKDQANGRRDLDDASNAPADPARTGADPGRDDYRPVDPILDDDSLAVYVDPTGLINYSSNAPGRA